MSSSSTMSSSDASSSDAMSSSSSSVAIGDAANGQLLFDSKSCSTCHASNGDGTFGGNASRFDINALNKAKDGLADFIEQFMPKGIGQPTDCVDSCALDIAAYLETFKTASSSSSDSSSSTLPSSSSVASSSSESAAPAVVYAYNFGGGTVIDGDTVFQQEDFVTTDEHHTSTIDGTIQGSMIAGLHKNQRWGKWTMNLPVSEGHYNVRVYTAEEYFTANNERLMNITAEGTTVANEMDIYAVAGHDAELIAEESNIFVNDGMLNIDFGASKDNATVSAIVVTSADGARMPLAKAAASDVNGIHYEPIDCGAPIAGQTQAFFGPAIDSYWGWDWINYPDDNYDYGGLRFQGREVYDLGKGNQKAPEADCQGDLTLRRTFVRKYDVPNHQHSNGLGIDGTTMPSLADVESVIIDLKLGFGTKVPPYFDVHDGIATLNVEAGDQGQTQIKLDQNKYLGQWLRVTIPASKLGNGKPSKMQFVAEFSNGPGSLNGKHDFMEVDVNIHQMVFKMK